MDNSLEPQIQNDPPSLRRTLLTAYKSTLKTVSNLVAILLCFTLIKEFREAIEFMREQYFLCILSFFLLSLLFLWQVIDQIRKDETYLKISIRKLESIVSLFSLKKYKNLVVRSKGKIKKSLSTIGVLASIASLLLMVSISAAISFTDAHYVTIASMPNHRSAITYIARFNTEVKRRDVNGLKARAYPSGGSNPWYMITINPSHFSRNAAFATLNRSKHLLGDMVPEDSYIHTSSRVSFRVRLKSIVLRFLE